MNYRQQMSGSVSTGKGEGLYWRMLWTSMSSCLFSGPRAGESCWAFLFQLLNRVFHLAVNLGWDVTHFCAEPMSLCLVTGTLKSMRNILSDTPEGNSCLGFWISPDTSVSSEEEILQHEHVPSNLGTGWFYDSPLARHGRGFGKRGHPHGGAALGKQ
jgi:hypothetical protein